MLLQELEQRRREVRQIIASLDREAEHLEAQAAQDNNLELYPRARQVHDDRDALRAELQFYTDLMEAFNYTPIRITNPGRKKQSKPKSTHLD